MTDFDALAARMFGGTTPTAAAPAAQPAQPTNDGNLGTAEVRDDADVAAVMFKDSPIHGDAERAIESALKEHELQAPAAAQAVAQEWTPIFNDLGLNSTESAQLTEIGLSAYINPPDATLVGNWEADAKAVLKQEYGVDGAHQALADAQALIARNPTLRNYLHETGLGSHPQVVRIAAMKARDLRARGKL